MGEWPRNYLTFYGKVVLLKLLTYSCFAHENVRFWTFLEFPTPK